MQPRTIRVRSVPVTSTQELAMSHTERDVMMDDSLARARHVCEGALAALVFALLAWLSPSAALAACSSTPAQQSFADAEGDDQFVGKAPDIVSVDLVVDSSCDVSVGVALSD